jgi:predicted N-acetyltransferase YhbS
MDKIQIPHSPTQEEYPELVKFLDQNLRPQNKWSISAEYPTAFSTENLHNIRVITDGSKILSHAALKPHIIKTPQAIFKVAAIGSVVTHSEYRNQGLSKTIITDCLELAQKQDCDLAMLWTNLYDFYQKMGFALAGFEISLTIDGNFSAVKDPQFKILKTHLVDPQAIHKLLSQHTVATMRSLEEIRKFLSIPNSNIYTLWESNGTIGAFAVEGKGADLGGYIHEWGGSVSRLIQLFKYIQTEQARTITVICPRHSQNLIEQCRKLNAGVHEGFLGMMKMVNEEKLFQKIQRHARQDLGVANLVLDKQGDEYRIGTTEQFICTHNEGEILQFIFGPRLFTDVKGLSKNTLDILDRVFPMPIWLWGWDSV